METWPTDITCAEPVAVAKHRRPVVVEMAVEEFGPLKALDEPARAQARVKRTKD